ncbi:putative disease resistance protein RGA3 [Panicum virgatum]|uniref:putative disease resistance protein RGA3 n=1 Tax=Panicum virgatum TaxID=38727 RepID=UPI0019D567DE|nr:putative disease resistance protein RGA3 [Panicum virgatum]
MARSINFILSKGSTPPAPALEDSLQRALLRAQVIVDEAAGRHVTNQAMLLQLDMLRDAVHKGSYALDSFRYQPHSAEDDDDRGQPARRSVPLFIATCAKIPRCSRGGTRILAQLREALDRLSSMVADADVLVLFLTSYPRQYRQPYGAHLMLEHCMFGRHMETEHVISFLLHAQQPSHGAEEPEVLPIVGPGRVGKTTLVTHVCKDERVRDHFSEIVLLNDLDFTDAELAALGQRCSNSNSRDGKFLVVVEVAGDFNEDAWSRLYSASKRWAQRGSKIIVTSRSDKITKVGTAQVVL